MSRIEQALQDAIQTLEWYLPYVEMPQDRDLLAWRVRQMRAAINPWLLWK